MRKSTKNRFLKEMNELSESFKQAKIIEKVHFTLNEGIPIVFPNELQMKDGYKTILSDSKAIQVQTYWQTVIITIYEAFPVINIFDLLDLLNRGYAKKDEIVELGSNLDIKEIIIRKAK